jgi:hypothetical protein
MWKWRTRGRYALHVQVHAGHHSEADICAPEQLRDLRQVVIADGGRDERARLLRLLRCVSASRRNLQVRLTNHRIGRVNVFEHRLVVLRLDLKGRRSVSDSA